MVAYNLVAQNVLNGYSHYFQSKPFYQKFLTYLKRINLQNNRDIKFRIEINLSIVKVSGAQALDKIGELIDCCFVLNEFLLTLW